MSRIRWKWTIEISRKLKTTSAKDIQFDDLAKTYSFAVAAFDNSQIGYAYENLGTNWPLNSKIHPKF